MMRSGNFAYKGTPQRREQIFSKLKGIKHLIRGNHDDDATMALAWSSTQDMKTISADGHRIFMCHYPMREWPGFYGTTLHFFGHCHNKLSGSQRCFDVGVDAIGYCPLRVDSIVEMMNEFPRQEYKEGTPFSEETQPLDEE